jgi:hypothetical protein
MSENKYRSDKGIEPDVDLYFDLPIPQVLWKGKTWIFQKRAQVLRTWSYSD